MRPFVNTDMIEFTGKEQLLGNLGDLELLRSWQMCVCVHAYAGVCIFACKRACVCVCVCVFVKIPVRAGVCVYAIF